MTNNSIKKEDGQLAGPSTTRRIPVLEGLEDVLGNNSKSLTAEELCELGLDGSEPKESREDQQSFPEREEDGDPEELRF